MDFSINMPTKIVPGPPSSQIHPVVKSWLRHWINKPTDLGGEKKKRKERQKKEKRVNAVHVWSLHAMKK